jgi:enamine deaminase RidA (YjgF/YER057c/UK114 family)
VDSPDDTIRGLKPRKSLIVLLLSLAVAFTAAAQMDRKTKAKKEEKEPVTQALALPKDPPSAAIGETAHLVFRTSTLTSKGLLSAQVHEALKALLQETHGATIIKLRAFVAGSGDLRRVQTLVSEVFTEHKLNIPALSTILVGALPMEGSQVVIESIAVDKRTANPNGLAFFSGQQAKDPKQSVAQLRTATEAVGVTHENVVRATCFLSSLDDLAVVKSAIAAAFPSASANFIQQQRLGLEPLVECEAVGRLEKSPGTEAKLVNPAGLAQNPNYSQIALVGSAKIVFSGTQMAFGDQEKDLRLAFDRLRKALETQSAGYKDVFWSGVYPMTKGIADKTRAIRFDYYDRARPPASTLLLFEGLPSLDATVAVEVAAAVN